MPKRAGESSLPSMPHKNCFTFMTYWRVDDNRVAFVGFATSTGTSTAPEDFLYLFDLKENSRLAWFWLFTQFMPIAGRHEGRSSASRQPSQRYVASYTNLNFSPSLTMNLPSTSEPGAPLACWAPCSQACYLTLNWPVAGAAMLRGPQQAICDPPVLPQPAHRLLALCDESGLRRLVLHHMRRLRHSPLFARSHHCFDCVTSRIADFVVESCGGPLYYSQRHAHLQAGAGLPLLLDEAGRELWLVQLWHTFDDIGFPPALRADFWAWAEPLSIHLLVRHARIEPPRRYPYELVRSWFHSPATDMLPPIADLIRPSGRSEP